MTDLTARVFHEQGIKQADFSEIFSVSGNLKPLLQNGRQHVELESIGFPAADLAHLNDTPMEVSLPLAKLDFSPLTQEEFVAELSRATVKLTEPWLHPSSSQAARVSVVDGQLKLSWEHANVNMVMELPPTLQLLMPTGQLTFIELRPQAVVLDTRASRIADALRQVAELEGSIEQAVASGEHPANIKMLQDMAERLRVEAERTRSEPAEPGYWTKYRKP
jgi:hypothetical protein